MFLFLHYTLHRPISVSYTHLDVYKRQEYIRPTVKEKYVVLPCGHFQKMDNLRWVKKCGNENLKEEVERAFEIAWTHKKQWQPADYRGVAEL